MISVIIPTLNGGPGFVRLLSALEAQSVPLEVIVIDSGSTDGTDEVALARGISLISIANDSFNHGAARNMAAHIAKGDLLVFMTQDSLPAEIDCIRTLTAVLDDPVNAAAYGRHLCHEEARPTEKFSREHNYPEQRPAISGETKRSAGIRDCFFSNVFSAVRRKEFEELGGFPENVIMFEDMLLAAKLLMRGHSVVYVPEAKVIHSHNLTPQQTFRRYFHAGVSFGMNPWFSAYSRSGSEGFRFVKEQMKYLAKHGEYGWMLFAVWENACKLAGYKLGLNYEKLPPSFVKRMTKL